MKRTRCLAAALLILGLCASPLGAAEPEAPFPIMAYGGPPEGEATVERSREFAGAGFTHNYSGSSSAEAMAKVLDVAREAGVKAFVACPELSADPEGTAKRFKDHPALAGYFLRDEPGAADFADLAGWCRRIQSVDSEHPCYINLFPNYATPQQLGTATYQEHLDRFVAEVPAQILSFDHYPVIRDASGERLRPEWYDNLERVSAAARKAGKPFWAFALSVAHDPYPIATVPHLRVQVYSNLAYGAQGIQYFTYWTSKSDTWNFHEAPIGLDGQRTPVYDRVKQVNQEIQALRGVFQGAQVLSVGHTGSSLPAGTRAYAPASPVAELRTEGTGAVVSMLAKGDQRFLVVVNRDINAPMPLTVKSQGGAVNVDRVEKDGTRHAITGGLHEVRVDPGDVSILAW